MANSLISPTKKKYIEHIQVSINNTLNDDYLFSNYKSQVFVKKLGVTFNSTFKEEYLWRRAINLSSNSCFLIKENINKDLAFKALKESAEIYEYLNGTTEKYDKDYLLILAAFCYDIAGYQANALCLIRDLIHRNDIYTFSGEPDDHIIESENYIVFHIQQILLKKIPYAKSKIKSSDDYGIELFNECISDFYENILSGKSVDLISKIKATYTHYIDNSNIYISHLLYLFQSRLIIYSERSIWSDLMSEKIELSNPIWKKYFRLLTNDFYDDSKIKSIESRTSKFEFWISQLRAVEKGIVGTNKSFVIQMPTSAGKTFIAELAIMDSLVKNPDKRCIYIAPFRALTNEKEIELSTNLSKLGYSVSAISGDYESDDGQDYVLNNTDVLIATPEKIDLLFRTQNDVFNTIGIVIVDEGHIIGNNDERSSLIEFLIIRMRIKLPDLRIIFISAVMPPKNSLQFSKWLNKDDNSVITSSLNNNSSEIWEPTRKLIASFNWTTNSSSINYHNVKNQEEKSKKNSPSFVNGFIKQELYGKRTFPKSDKGNETAVGLAYKLSIQGNCLIFCSQPNYVESVAKAFLDFLSIVVRKEEVKSWFSPTTNRESYHYSLEWFGSNHYITQCISRGIGIHYGDLPEAVRRSVEKDYQKGKLRILISTNTIGQGLNFPIKNLIIHSLIINAQENTKISVRDFWNIVGRAGRAGKETEGQVIFLTITQSQLYNFHYYTDRANIEQADSPFIKVLLEYLTNSRLPSALRSGDSFDDKMQLFSESYLLDMLIEETIDSDDEKIINQIIDNSLFKVQAVDRKLDLGPLKRGFTKVAKNIKENVVDQELQNVFGKTGFTLKSNLFVDEFIKENLNEIIKYLAKDDYQNILSLIFKLFDSGKIKEIIIKKLELIDHLVSDSNNLILKWISGLEIKELQELWLRSNQKEKDFYVFFSEGLFYRYPWGVTSFLSILAYRLNRTVNDFPANTRNLAGFLKYGLNQPSACTARRLGVKKRTTSLFLARLSQGKLGEDFIKWLSNVNLEDLKGHKLEDFDIENILEVAVKINPKRKIENVAKVLIFNIKGIEYSKERIQTSNKITLKDVLTYQRDITNEFDPFAIKIFYNKKELGFIPREVAKVISTEIDLSGKYYKIRVRKIMESSGEIEVEMSEDVF